MRFNIRNILGLLSVAVVATSRWALPSTSQPALVMALPDTVAADGTAHFSFDMSGVDINSIDMTGVDLDTTEDNLLDQTEAPTQTDAEDTFTEVSTEKLKKLMAKRSALAGQLSDNVVYPTTLYTIMPNRGVRLAGLEEFPPRRLTLNDSNYYVSVGMNTFTISIRWEALQPNLSLPIDFTSGFGEELSTLLENFCDEYDYVSVALEMSNSMRYNGQVIGAENSTVTTQHFVNAWYQIALRFISGAPIQYNCLQFLNLMGKPDNCSTELLVKNYNAVQSALQFDVTNGFYFIYEGNGGSEISKWFSNSYGTPNSQLFASANLTNSGLIGIRTLLQNPNTGDCYNPSEVLAAEGVMNFIYWAQLNSVYVFFSAIGSEATPNCIGSLNVLLNIILEYGFELHYLNPFVGYTAYTGGNSTDYKFDLTLYDNCSEKLQMSQGFDLNLAPPAVAPIAISSNGTKCFPPSSPNNPDNTSNTTTIIEATVIPSAAVLAAAGFFCLRKRCKNNGEQQPLLQENNKRCCV